ncbi:MAG: carbohydrate porin [Planctomycetia bacterium]|nr:carbohydrate porin [Planctomycetia bacterium]
MRKYYYSLLAACAVSLAHIAGGMAQEPVPSSPPEILPVAPAPVAPVAAPAEIVLPPIPAVPESLPEIPPVVVPELEPITGLGSPVVLPPACTSGRCPLRTLPAPGTVSIPQPPVTGLLAPAPHPTMLPEPGALGAYDSLVLLTADPSAAEAPPAAPPPPPPFGGPLGERPNLLGDWRGARGSLRERGFNFDIYSTNFGANIANGGLTETLKYRGRMDYLLNIDGEKAGLWKGFFIDLHGESVFGDSINQFSGTLMPLSVAQLFPVPTGSSTALTGVKFTQALSENFVLFAGKLNTLDGFNQPFTGGARGVNGFWNGAMLFNPVFIRSVPYSTFGGGFAILRNMEPVVSFVLLDANNTPNRDGFDTFFDNGVVFVPQINIPTKFFGLPGHQGITASYSTRSYTVIDRSAFIFPILLGVAPPRKNDSWSIAYNFDQALYVDPCNPKRSWGIFGNLGIADVNPSPFRWAANIGVGGSSLIASRPLDTWGLGYFYLGFNNSLQKLAPRLLPFRDGEQGIEMFYNAAVTPWFHITPDLQIVHPGQRRADTLLYFGLRAKVDF